jgi:hypothetical protein
MPLFATTGGGGGGCDAGDDELLELPKLELPQAAKTNMNAAAAADRIKCIACIVRLMSVLPIAKFGSGRGTTPMVGMTTARRTASSIGNPAIW